MNLHEKQYFDFLLATATERFVERIEQRNGGASPALEKLRENPNSPGIWLDDFTAAIFRDFLLDNVEGSAMILCALSRRPNAALPAGNIASTLQLMAQRAFADLLQAKTEELLEQHIGYQAMHT